MKRPNDLRYCTVGIGSYVKRMGVYLSKMSMLERGLGNDKTNYIYNYTGSKASVMPIKGHLNWSIQRTDTGEKNNK